MNWPLNSRWRLLLALICAAVVLLAGKPVQAASTREKNEFNAAAKAFNDGFMDRAESAFAQFVEKNPASDLVPEALLRQAQAQIKLGKFGAAISLLTPWQGATNKLADQFLYLKGEAQIQSTNFADAADTFGKLAANFEASPRRLEAAVGEASARAKLGEWPRVVELLNKPGGSFQKAVVAGPESEWATRGFLLLAEAELQRRNYREAEAALRLINSGQLAPELAWQKQYLLCRSQLGDGRAADALDSSTNLPSLAEVGGRGDLLAESIAFRAGIFEQLGRLDEAAAAFKLNVTNAPPERQRQALAKIAELALAEGRTADAMQTLEWFLAQFTNAPATDLALLALGELHLKQHVALAGTNGVSPGTNHLAQALGNFDRLISVFPESPLVGKAQLDRGWCYWSANKISESADSFKAAVARLSPSEDLVVARFKLADALFVQGDFTNALLNYRAAQEVAGNWPRAKAALASQSLYQVLRASLELKDMAGATNAMREILESYPLNVEADRSVLLVAQGFADLDDPDAARALFEKFIAQSPDSELRPEVELALARTSEMKADWPAALAQYEKWLERFGTNQLRPQAEFYRALASFHTGNETNALNLFINFVAQFATNALAPQAQWWVADHFYRQGEFFPAEINFKPIFQNWPNSDLAYDARMMAGRAAIGYSAYVNAIGHFTNLTSNPNCPPGLRIQATFAYGGTLMSLAAVGTNKLIYYQEAIRVLGTIPQLNPDTEPAALAWGEIANCNLQLASQDESYYTNAIQAYQQVINSASAGVAARSQAQVGLARAWESWATRKTGVEKIEMLNRAVSNYQDVLYESNLREGETRQMFWVREAGTQAAQLLAETLGEWERAKKLYERLADLLPESKPAFQKKIAAMQEHLAAQKN